MVSKERQNEWPLSNYPMLMALILLVTTAIVLGHGGSEAYANQLAIYAYFLLAAGVAVRFFELTLPETFIQRLKEKLPEINRRENSLRTSKDCILGFFADVARNVFFSLLIFFLIALCYGALVDWFFVEKFIVQLGYIIIIFLALHLVLRVRL